MPSRFDQHLSGHFGRLRTAAGTAIVYRRPGSSDISIASAVRARSEFEVADETGMLINLEVIDWLIAASDLVLDDAPLLPADGDEIIATDGRDVEVTYRVLSPGGDEPAWRWMDRLRTEIRIHTKVADG